MSRLRCVVDTNVVIAAILSPSGLPNRLLRHLLDEHRMLVSPASMRELSTRLQRPKFDAYLPAGARERLVGLLTSRAEEVAVTTVVTESVDPDDNPILALAADGRADVIVTGDRKHLLPLHPWRGIAVLSPRELADRIGLP